MAVSLLSRLAAGARAPVFPLVGDGGRTHARQLSVDPRLEVVSSPRHATVLVALGRFPEAVHEAALRVHDQLPTPRGTVVLGESQSGHDLFAGSEAVERAEDLADAAVAMHSALMTGEREPEPALGPSESPVEWKGVGPHGQGGEGMMGGEPYGRPMAMTGPDLRDGLELDRVTIPLGPFLAWLPPGLCVDLTLQGDVIQEARVDVAPFHHRDEPEVFRRAEAEEVPLAELELARARHHLWITSDLLALHGLRAQAHRVARLALELAPGDEGRVRGLGRRLRWSGALRAATRGVGTTPADDVRGMGAVARAAGIDDDARSEDPAYRELGFSPLVHRAGDAEARLRQRLGEAAQALALAVRAGDRTRAPGPALEGVRGPGEPDGMAWRRLVERLCAGQAFDAFATTVVSLDLDPATLPPREDEEGGSGHDHGHDHGGHH